MRLMSGSPITYLVCVVLLISGFILYGGPGGD